MSENYFVNRNFVTQKKIRNLLSELPFFCDEFIRGIENQTTYLTRLNYIQDIKIFLEFLCNEVLEFNSKKIRDITIEDLSLVTSTHIEMFLNYISSYKKDDKIIINNEKGKARKLSSIRSLLKYFYKIFLKKLTTQKYIPRTL